MSSYPDVAIIGGGFAGLAAARELVAHGISVELFEATERLGGRAQTMHGDVELGPELVYGCPPATLELLREAHIETEPIRDNHHRWHAGQLVKDDKGWERFGKLLDDVGDEARSRAAREPRSRS